MLFAVYIHCAVRWFLYSSIEFEIRDGDMGFSFCCDIYIACGRIVTEEERHVALRAMEFEMTLVDVIEKYSRV